MRDFTEGVDIILSPGMRVTPDPNLPHGSFVVPDASFGLYRAHTGRRRRLFLTYNEALAWLQQTAESKEAPDGTTE